MHQMRADYSHGDGEADPPVQFGYLLVWLYITPYTFALRLNASSAPSNS